MILSALLVSSGCVTTRTVVVPANQQVWWAPSGMVLTNGAWQVSDAAMTEILEKLHGVR